MTKQQPGLFNKCDSTRHFLFSKTDTQRLKDQRVLPREGTWKTLSALFPEVLAGKRFIDDSLSRLENTARFGAMVLRVDDLSRQTDRSGKYKKIARTLDALCQKEDGRWGILAPGMLGCFLTAKDARHCLVLARAFQKTLAAQTSETVTIGIAEYPTSTFRKQHVLENARKAVEHAAFFGPGSAVIFDSVSLNISGDQLYEKGNVKGAIEEFIQALVLDSSNINVHNSLGVCYGVLGDYQSAMAEFKAATDLDPKEFMAVYNLGLVHMLNGQRDRALELFLKADRMAGDVFEIVFQTGKLYLESAEPVGAQKFLEKASRLRPDAGAVYRYLGECHASAGRTDAAVAAYKKAVKHNPGDAASLSALGCLFDEQGENAEIALMFCRESVKLSPQNGLFRHRLGRLYLKQNRLKEALKEFNTAAGLGYEAADFIHKIKHQMQTKAL
jgi:tetratricopeptide (TPR) repeat protein